MIKKSELELKTIAQLKEIAGTYKIKYKKTIKKDEIIKLILEFNKVSETAKQKKSDLDNNPTSQTSSGMSGTKEFNKDFFQKISEMPSVYGKDKIVFMVRDPYWGFVYWEITDHMRALHKLGNFDVFLRCYEISGGKSAESSNSLFDIKINPDSDNWYIKFPIPNSTYIIDYGYFKDGKFVTLIRSNAASLPRDNISDQIDVEWMMSPDQFNMLLQASGADQLFQQIGSQELMKFISSNVNEEKNNSSGFVAVSGGIASSSSGFSKK